MIFELRKHLLDRPHRVITALHIMQFARHVVDAGGHEEPHEGIRPCCIDTMDRIAPHASAQDWHDALSETKEVARDGRQS